MRYELILVRYGEIALKGKQTRKNFEKILIDNIKNALKSNNVFFKIKKDQGRIYIYTDKIDESTSILRNIFGITSISPAFETTDDIETISELSVKFTKSSLTKDRSFAIRATRTGDHTYSSQDVAVKVGSDIVAATKADVDLSKPDFELFIEIRDKKAFVFTKKIRAVGGMPLNSQGKVMSIINKKKDVLAAWYLMRRGCKSIFVTSDKDIRGVLEVFTSKWYAKLDLMELSDKTNLDKITKEKNCKAIVTGHCLCEKPSEEMLELKELTKKISCPLLHPLIAMSEDEINEKIREIGL